MSFEIAAKNIGYQTILENNPLTASSIAKGETLYDTLKTISYYVDAIIMRHPDKNIVEKNIKGINIPIINAGFGTWEHPTQSLIDFYTFHHQMTSLNKKLENTKLAVVGDLNSRTAQSVIKLAVKFNISLLLVNHSSYPLENKRKALYDTLSSLIEYQTVETNDQFRNVIKNVDIVYYSNYIGTHCDETRIKMFQSFYLPLEYLQEQENNSGHIIHTYSPLPRRPEEMDIRIDDTKYDLSFPAIKFSVYLRQVLLKHILQS